MGCTTSVHVKVEMGKSEKAIKAALLIQQWYRRSMSRLEARRRTSWAIFQSIEYAGEQDQVKLSKFFNTMLEQFSVSNDQQDNVMKAFGGQRFLPTQASCSVPIDRTEELQSLLIAADPQRFPISGSYHGPHLEFPVTRDQIKSLVTAFRERKILHVHYLLQLLQNARVVLMGQPNIKRVSTFFSGQVTVCGDLHGNFNDLYAIFQKNGLPGSDNPYIFNGDYVDRGTQSVEVMIVLLSCLLYNPRHLHLNRGNHEDPVMNIRYGFTKEIFKKYKKHGVTVVRMFKELFSWLPLATIVDEEVFIVHGGLSDTVDLDYVDSIERNKYVSVLRPPALVKMETDGEDIDSFDLEEWKQMLDLLWSDPREQSGCYPNNFRGGGCYFGPDVTSHFLQNNDLRMLIRSHECKKEGYEYTHGKKVLTVFSASNYYEEGSNKGAYVKIMADRGDHNVVPDCHVIQFISDCRRQRKLTFTERVSHLETSALNQVRELIITNRTKLEREFIKLDPNNTGLIDAVTWCHVLESVINLDVPWESLQPRLVHSATDEQNSSLVEYKTTFLAKRVSILHTQPGGPSVTESLYRNKDILETIFRTFDMDSSGRISMEEFSQACQILIEHSDIGIQSCQILDIARSLDLNKDGFIDFNEFLEAFRIVDSQERRKFSSVCSGVGILDTIPQQIGDDDDDDDNIEDDEGNTLLTDIEGGDLEQELLRVQ